MWRKDSKATPPQKQSHFRFSGGICGIVPSRVWRGFDPNLWQPSELGRIVKIRELDKHKIKAGRACDYQPLQGLDATTETASLELDV
jgi:hypothetical protein